MYPPWTDAEGVDPQHQATGPGSRRGDEADWPLWARIGILLLIVVVPLLFGVLL